MVARRSLSRMANSRNDRAPSPNISASPQGLQGAHWSSVIAILRLGHLANEHLALMNRHIRVADQRGQVVDDVAGGDALVTPVPRQADVVHAAVAELVRPDAARNQCLGPDRGTRRGDDDV